MSELRNYEVKYVNGLIAEVERLTAEHRTQNECIADQHDTIRLQAKRIAKLEAALQDFLDYGYHRGRCEAALQKDNPDE